MSNKSGSAIKTLATAIIIVLLTVGLSLFMITDVFTPGSQNAVALVGKSEVNITQFDSTYRRRLDSYNRANGTKLTAAQAYEQGFAQQVLDQMITAKVIEIDADMLGVGVARKLASDNIKETEFFQDEITGRFSEDKFNQVLANNRIDRKTYENDIATEIKVNQVVSATVAGIKAPLSYAAQRYKYLTEQRKVSVLTLRAASVPAPTPPTDEVLKAYIEDNAANYTAPEYRSFTILRMELTDINPDLDASEDEVRELYQYKLETGKLGSPETRSVTLINATNEAIAKEAMTALAQNEDAASVASGLGLVEPTLYEDVTKDDLIDPAAADAAFAAETGTSQVVEGKLGWFVVRVDGVSPAVLPSFEELREELEAELKESQATGKLYDMVDAVEDQMGEGLSLEESAKAAGASVSSIDYISRLGLTQDDKRLSGISVITGVADDDIILTEIFTNDIDFQTDTFETSKGGYAAIRVDDIIDSARRPFEDVRGQALAAWTNEQIAQSLDDLMESITTRVRDGETLADIKDSLDAGTALEDIIMVRSSRAPSLGPSVAVRAFEAREGEVVRGQGPELLTRNVAVINKVIANSDNMAGGFADAMQQQATQELSGDIQQAYRAAILAQNKVITFDDKIRRQLGVTE